MLDVKVGDRVSDVDYLDDPGTVLAVYDDFAWVRFDSSEPHDRPSSCRITELVPSIHDLSRQLLEACEELTDDDWHTTTAPGMYAKFLNGWNAVKEASAALRKEMP